MNIGVIGLGYVGIVTAACFASMGHNVHCAGLDVQRAEQLQAGQLPFYEEGLEPLLNTQLEAGNLKFDTHIEPCVAHADLIFLCVASTTNSGGQTDLKPLQAVAEKMIHGLSKQRKLIVERSILPIKTGDWLRHQFQKASPDQAAAPEFDLAVVPQFLREGSAVADFFAPDRVVIGAENQASIDVLVQLFAPLNAPILITDIHSAELIKHATNAFLAMKISFINSIAQICEKTGADITQVSRGLGLDRRISAEFLNAGIGYGGIFLPQDINALIAISSEHHLNLDLLKATDVVNRYQRISFIERIEKALGGSLEGKTVAVWGLAYRPNTDDMRDAPSAQILWGLQNRGAQLKAYDPIAMPNAREKLKNVQYCDSPYEAAKGADVIAVLTEWDEFTRINFRQVKEVSSCRLIVDGRNLYSLKRMQELGFTYVSMGRSEVSPSSPAP